jgi:ABC-type phosphate transport system substrate-binding protein
MGALGKSGGQILVRTIGLVVVGALLLTGSTAPAAPSMGGFKVIVNSSIEGKKLDREVLAQIYLGHAQRWGDGRAITAVDQSSTSKVRAAFSWDVLEMPVARVQQHWLRSMSLGKTPPRTKNTDDEVIAFVSAESGAVGYVSDAAVLPASVRAVAVQ